MAKYFNVHKSSKLYTNTNPMILYHNIYTRIKSTQSNSQLSFFNSFNIYSNHNSLYSVTYLESFVKYYRLPFHMILYTTVPNCPNPTNLFGQLMRLGLFSLRKFVYIVQILAQWPNDLFEVAVVFLGSTQFLCRFGDTALRCLQCR